VWKRTLPHLQLLLVPQLSSFFQRQKNILTAKKRYPRDLAQHHAQPKKERIESGNENIIFLHIAHNRRINGKKQIVSHVVSSHFLKNQVAIKKCRRPLKEALTSMKPQKFEKSPRV
jgi:hypothetical protein